jgi:hypothetical protein
VNGSYTLTLIFSSKLSKEQWQEKQVPSLAVHARQGRLPAFCMHCPEGDHRVHTLTMLQWLRLSPAILWNTLDERLCASHQAVKQAPPQRATLYACRAT